MKGGRKGGKPHLVRPTGETCNQCRNSISAEDGDYEAFADDVRSIGGWPRGHGRDYCYNCWAAWRREQHGPGSVVVEMNIEFASTEGKTPTSVSCQKVISDEEVPIRLELGTATSVGMVRRALRESLNIVPLRLTPDDHFHSREQFAAHSQQDHWRRIDGWDFVPADGERTEQLKLLHKDRALTVRDDGALLSNMLSDTTFWTGDAVTDVGTETRLSGKMLIHGISVEVIGVNGDWFIVCFETLVST
ncbi:unnamed protein product [Polarella glacialis]|uniref:Uncharacterized protein n=1 Tax=Polarella glacialis TaxID=89957 RepID=A0A813KMU7_POLGL|nr:unnamed protein product [Polarella glacialis]CAE8703461.1 unnamed protein product [Polarella glacialis]